MTVDDMLDTGECAEECTLICRYCSYVHHLVIPQSSQVLYDISNVVRPCFYRHFIASACQMQWLHEYCSCDGLDQMALQSWMAQVLLLA